MNEESLDGKWSRIDERTRIILENIAVIFTKIEDLQTAVQDGYATLGNKIDEHERSDDAKFLTRREGGMIAATVAAIATFYTVIGIFWIK